jgi:predicted transcriptional regulator
MKTDDYKKFDITILPALVQDCTADTITVFAQFMAETLKRDMEAALTIKDIANALGMTTHRVAREVHRLTRTGCLLMMPIRGGTFYTVYDIDRFLR